MNKVVKHYHQEKLSTVLKLYQQLDKGGYKLNMAAFDTKKLTRSNARSRTLCGSVCCIAGSFALVDDYANLVDFFRPEEKGFNYGKYSESFLIPMVEGLDEVDPEAWDYLFGANHPNNISKAIDRIKYAIKHGVYDPEVMLHYHDVMFLDSNR